jgi:hypothetical protein
MLNMVRSSKAAKNVAAGLSVAALSIAAIATIAPSASAAGTSNKTNGCYSTWGNTAFVGHCNPVTVAGQFQNYAVCDWEADFGSAWYRFGRGSYIDQFGSRECTFKVINSYVKYTNG